MTPLEMVEDYCKRTGQGKKPILYLKLIHEEYYEWTEEAQRWPPKQTSELKELADLVYVIYGYANAMGWDLDTAVERVHNNNVERMVQDDGRIHRRDDGKIIKNPNTPKVNLEDLV